MSKQKKYHFIYKTTCLITNKFYVGMHSTDNINDGYLGSGKILGYSRHKYGDENHVREIVEMCSSPAELKLREKDIVNEELLANPLNINLRYGGEGGGGFASEEHREKWIAAGRSTPDRMEKITETIRRRKEEIPGYAEAIAKKHRENKKDNFTFTGRTHTEETRNKMRKSKNVGETNSQFGSCWVTDGVKPIKIKKEQLNEYIAQGYSQGRKKVM